MALGNIRTYHTALCAITQYGGTQCTCRLDANWWCSICRAGNGDIHSAYPPDDHVCEFYNSQAQPNGILNIPESRLDVFIHWAKNDKVLARISVLLILAVWYLAIQMVRWAIHP